MQYFRSATIQYIAKLQINNTIYIAILWNNNNLYCNTFNHTIHCIGNNILQYIVANTIYCCPALMSSAAVRRVQYTVHICTVLRGLSSAAVQRRQYTVFTRTVFRGLSSAAPLHDMYCALALYCCMTSTVHWHCTIAWHVLYTGRLVLFLLSLLLLLMLVHTYFHSHFLLPFVVLFLSGGMQRVMSCF